MFERYDEPARRAIFFARYEASQNGAWAIGSVHLLLGVLRESRGIFTEAGLQVSLEDLAEACRQALPLQGEKTSTSVDMPLTEEAKNALGEATKQADILSSRTIKPLHLTLGLIAASEEVAAILSRHGVTAESLGSASNSIVTKSAETTSPGALLEFVCQGERVATSPINFVNPLPRVDDKVTFTRGATTETYKVLSVRHCFEGPPLSKTPAHCWLVKVVIETEHISSASE